MTKLTVVIIRHPIFLRSESVMTILTIITDSLVVSSRYPNPIHFPTSYIVPTLLKTAYYYKIWVKSDNFLLRTRADMGKYENLLLNNSRWMYWISGTKLIALAVTLLFFPSQTYFVIINKCLISGGVWPHCDQIFA